MAYAPSDMPPSRIESPDTTQRPLKQIIMSNAFSVEPRPKSLRHHLAVLIVAGMLASGMTGALGGMWALLGPLFGSPPWSLPALMALWLVCGSIGLIPASRLVPVFMARFDDSVLQVMPAPPANPRCADPATMTGRQVWQNLYAWCQTGAGPGGSRWWRPGERPAVTSPFAVAALTYCDDVNPYPFTQTLCRELDASPRLEACSSRWAGLRLRLGVKLQECVWWRMRREEDPWDSGYLLSNAVQSGALACFQPRRATLIVADPLTAEVLGHALHILYGRRHLFDYPVRLLLVNRALPTLPAWGTDSDLGTMPIFTLSSADFTPPPSAAA